MAFQKETYEWHADLEIGVPQIDKEHAQLFKIFRKIQSLLEAPEKQKFACVEGIKFIRSHALQHFAHEEQYMRSINYKGYEMHRELHRAFTFETLPALEQYLESHDYSPKAIEYFVGICIGWLTSHTLFEDRAIVGKVNAYWDDPNPDINHFLIQSLSRVMEELAHISLSVVNPHYSGEDVGQTINFQTIYDDGSKKPWQVTVAFEPRLAFKLASVLFRAPIENLDEVSLTALKELVQMCVHRMGVFQNSNNNFKILKERSLSDRELQYLFEKDAPQYSILFSTGHGVMIFTTDEAKYIPN